MTAEDNDVAKAKRPFKKSKRKSKFDPKAKFGSKNKTQQHNEEIGEIDRKTREFNPENAEKFEDFPLSQATLKGLGECNYTKPTLIQKLSLPLALQGSNILGAAKTGSGKTLAFVIPILEKLFRMEWSAPHGIGALIITPTRELAEQIFTVFKKVGKYHNFSAGLIIGGRSMEKESSRLVNINIVISTPGRLVHHLRETYGFDLNTLQILVLDEADRMLDMGFKNELNTIIDSLPDERQTLLYSATQTRCRTDLQRLNCKNYFLVCEKVTDKSDLISMPEKLEQIYMVCKAEEKVNLLYSFLVQDVKRKILVFMSTCKQVRFIHEAFQKINKDVTFLAIHGSMKQKKRSEMFEKFMFKRHCVMFATDVACRGLDFPSVDWVVQLDCPADVETYIHRVGRTARYEDDGMALLFLLPSEKTSMLKELKGKGIMLQEEKPKKGKIVDIEKKLESFVMDSQQWEDFARKALVTYLKSIVYMKNKEIFDVSSIDRAALAKSLGIHNTLKIQKDFQSTLGKGGEAKSSLKNVKKRKRDDSEEEDDDDDSGDVETKDVRTKKHPTKTLSIKKMKATKSTPDDEPEEGKKKSEVQRPQSIEERRRLLLEKDADDNALSKQKRHKKKLDLKKKIERQRREESARNKEEDEDDEDEDDDNDEGDYSREGASSDDGGDESQSNDDDDDEDEDDDGEEEEEVPQVKTKKFKRNRPIVPMEQKNFKRRKLH